MQEEEEEEEEGAKSSGKRESSSNKKNSNMKLFRCHTVRSNGNVSTYNPHHNVDHYARSPKGIG